MFLEWVLIGLAFAVGFVLMPYILYFLAMFLLVVTFVICFVIGVLMLTATFLGGKNFKAMKTKLDINNRLEKLGLWLKKDR